MKNTNHSICVNHIKTVLNLALSLTGILNKQSISHELRRSFYLGFGLVVVDYIVVLHVATASDRQDSDVLVCVSLGM